MEIAVEDGRNSSGRSFPGALRASKLYRRKMSAAILPVNPSHSLFSRLALRRYLDPSSTRSIDKMTPAAKNGHRKKFGLYP